jgi:hypothetical protein
VDDLADRFARAERRGLLHIVRASGDLSLEQLIALIDDSRLGRLLGSLSLHECQTLELDEDALALHDKARSRASYEDRILAALRDSSEPLSPSEVWALVGGEIRDTRVALQRLTAARKISRTWKARGHGYEVARP